MAAIFYRGRKYRIPSDTKTRLLKNARYILQNSLVNDSEVRWVLCVPATWTEEAKDFLRHAAHRVCENES